jgi:hypothetical protein
MEDPRCNPPASLVGNIPFFFLFDYRIASMSAGGSSLPATPEPCCEGGVEVCVVNGADGMFCVWFISHVL